MTKYLYFALLATVAACTVGPDYQRPAEYSDSEISKSLNLQSDKAQQINKDWYKSFQDKTLDRLVPQGLVSSPNAKIAVAKLRQARASLQIESVQNLPMIDADGSYHYSKVGKNSGYPIGTDYFQTGLDATWELDIWGKGRRQTESAAALYKAAAADVDNTNLSLTAEIAADYINYRMAQEQLRISEQNLTLQEDIYNIVNSKYTAGLEDESALNQAKYAVETTKALIPELQYQTEAYKNALSTLVGELPGGLDEVLAADKKNLIRRRFKLNLNRLYELPVSVVRLRPDVRIAEYQLISKNANVGAAIAQLYPNISLSGFLGFQSSKVPNLIADNSFTYSYAPAIDLPVLHWGELTNNVELQKGVAEEYVYLYQNALLNAAAEIKNAYTAIAREYEKNQAARNAVVAQKKVLDLTLERYRQGLVDFNVILSAEQNLLDAQNSFIASNGAIYQDVIAFYKAIGGGYRESAQEKLKCVSEIGTPMTCPAGNLNLSGDYYQ